MYEQTKGKRGEPMVVHWFGQDFRVGRVLAIRMLAAQIPVEIRDDGSLVFTVKKLPSKPVNPIGIRGWITVVARCPGLG
jgi:hypothetical protein